jgi:hypothetical protein
VANSRKLITRYLDAAEVSPSQNDVFDLHRRSGNPGFDPTLAAEDPNQDDNGVDMQTMLEAAFAYRTVPFVSMNSSQDMLDFLAYMKIECRRPFADREF